jgi:hypothetical protein
MAFSELLPQNTQRKYHSLIGDIDQGRVKIPRFQRDFVWDRGRTASLLDSIIKGYPVGTFIIWKTHENFPTPWNIGNHKIPDTPAGEPVQLVLDGQQRITSLYAVLKGLRIDREGKEIDYSKICIDLGPEPDDQEQCVLPEPDEDSLVTVTVHDLLTKSFKHFDDYTDEQRDKIEYYGRRLKSYDFSVIEMPEYSIDTACEIFTRINTGGKTLSVFEILVAKTYDPAAGFDLEEKYRELLSGSDEGGKCLADASFDTIPSRTVLECVSAHIQGGISHGEIMGLYGGAVADSWDHVRQTIFHAVDHLRNHLGVVVSTLLPYPVLLVPFSRFFDKNGMKPPNVEQSAWLAEYFRRVSLENRYGSGVARKMAVDLARIDRIAQGKRPSYTGEDFRITPELFMDRSFAVNDSFSKAVLCLLASLRPRNLVNGGEIHVDNTWLGKSASRNIHHIFPKAYVKKVGKKGWNVNALSNIMFADEHTNQKVILARAPSDYIADFKRRNPRLEETLATHLIDDVCLRALLRDDFETFTNHRAQLIADKIK